MRHARRLFSVETSCPLMRPCTPTGDYVIENPDPKLLISDPDPEQWLAQPICGSGSGSSWIRILLALLDTDPYIVELLDPDP
jgi:hypothetical protein